MLGTFDLNADVAGRLELIRYRGPDGSGVATSGPATHGHVRLALLDLTDSSAQPFRRGAGLLSFVGEIWNHAQVRDLLEREGEVFSTTGDTEVLAAALDRWGVDGALPRLEGMFSIAWSKGDVHILARDRFGKIPLYVHRSASGGFAWSSELKGLPGMAARALPAGYALDLASGALARWYGLPASSIGRNTTLLSDLANGVEARLVADAPLCALVSGGLDSTAILALAVRTRPDIIAFTAKLDEQSTDLAAARRVCADFGVRLIEVKIASPRAEDLAAAVKVIEIPSKAQVEIAALCIPLAHAIASEGFKACLSGEAADELFGGYGSMCIKGSSADDAGWRAIRVAQLEKMARGNFVRCNKAFMAAGVECRLPFMHRALVERVVCMTKRECPPGKRALKEAVSGLVPPYVVKRTKDTFQGASGMADAAAGAASNPRRFYAAEHFAAFGRSVG